MDFGIRPGLSLITAVIEGILFTGVIYGWSSLSFVLIKEKYFYDGCQNNTTSEQNFSDPSLFGDCTQQKESIALVATIGLATTNLSVLVAGAVFDRYGTLVTRVLGTVTFTISCFVLAYSAPATSVMLYPGHALMAVGGKLIVIPNLKIGNLFKNRRATIISLIQGCIDTSGIVFLVMKYAYQAGISIKASFLFLAICTVLLWVRTLFLMPRYHIPYPIPKDGFPLGLFNKSGSNQTMFKTR